MNNVGEKLKEFDQEHVLTFFEELSQEEKEQLVSQIESVDFGVIRNSLANMMVDERGEISPISVLSIDEIEERFGKRVRELVESETEDKRADLPPASTWRIRKEESLAVLKNTDDLAVLMVWLGDKLANMRSIYRDFKVEGNAMWQRFHQKDVTEQAWYYRSIANLTERLSNTSAWLEYKTLTELVFGKGE